MNLPPQLWVWDTVKVNVLSFCVCAWIYQMKTFTHKGHTGNGLATISCQGGHVPVVVCKCCCSVKSDPTLRTHSSIHCVSLFAWLSIVSKIPPFCVLMRAEWGVFQGGSQPWATQTFRNWKLDSQRWLECRPGVANGNICWLSKWVRESWNRTLKPF